MFNEIGSYNMKTAKNVRTVFVGTNFKRNQTLRLMIVVLWFQMGYVLFADFTNV